jgi:predicted ATP-dependent endonuclease of OLD family
LVFLPQKREMSRNPETCIQEIHLKGFKSIKDLSVNLQPGLNIIIGANGSGKTNFLEFLDAIFKDDYERLLTENEFNITIKGRIDAPEGTFLVDKTGKKNTDRRSKKEAFIIEEHLIDGEININHLDDDKKLTSGGSTILKPSVRFLQFENPLNFILREKINIKINFTDEENEQYGYVYDINTHLMKSFKHTFLNDLFDIDPSISRNRWHGYKSIEDAVQEAVNNKMFDIRYLIKSLNQFTPIKDFKIDWALTRRTIKKDENNEKSGTASIEGIDFQFFVNDEWLNWTQLSDGTKRLFYLIGSFVFSEPNQIFLLEEPEIGIYPHQLNLLMNFIKAQSQHTQILLTTHSPQVLNCLTEEELDCIIVARYEGKAGTKMYHLSDEEKEFASNYMKNEAFLSDYWMQSGFMNEESIESL